MLELGRLGETDSLFTLFLAGSLLTWKWCRNAGVSERRAWCCGYALAALATLTKGPQAPLYFVGSVALFCLITGRKRAAVSKDHFMGLLTGLAIVGLWQVPYAIKMGPRASYDIYFHDVGPRFFDFTVGNVLGHMVTYPLELLAGSLLPWSAWLICLLSADFRRHLRRWRSDVLYLTVCMAVAFPSVWIVPGASLRYYMSLFPCFACLVGILVEARVKLPANQVWSDFVCWYQRIAAMLIFLVGGAVRRLFVVATTFRDGTVDFVYRDLFHGVCPGRHLDLGAFDTANAPRDPAQLHSRGLFLGTEPGHARGQSASAIQ